MFALNIIGLAATLALTYWAFTSFGVIAGVIGFVVGGSIIAMILIGDKLP